MSDKILLYSTGLVIIGLFIFSMLHQNNNITTATFKVEGMLIKAGYL
jgi:hypothetical protein